MFQVILYAWVILTAVVVFLILRSLYRWLLGLAQRNKQANTSNSARMVSEGDEDDSAIAAQDVETITDIRETDAGIVVDTVTTEQVGDTIRVTESISIIEPMVETIMTSEEEPIITDDAHDTSEDDMQAEPLTDMELTAENDQEEIPEVAVETEAPLAATVTDAPEQDNIHTATLSPSNASRVYPLEDAAPEIEIPKDIEASRNIAQGHSRDDIVRDKFEKHIAKIRYDAGILKQRNDILGYEKKLVEGLTLLPTDKVLQRQLADLYFQQGKYKKAHSLLKKILTDNPEDHNALWQLGEITLEEGHRDDAYVYFSKAYALCDDNPKYCLSLAQWYYDAEDYAQALPMMERVVKLRPKQIDYLVSLSHVQLKLGLRDEAKQSLLRAQELDPMNITLKQYLKGL